MVTVLTRVEPAELAPFRPGARNTNALLNCAAPSACAWQPCVVSKKTRAPISVAKAPY